MSRLRLVTPIRGRNTWVLWGEGNDVFWNWVQQKGYGLTDFLRTDQLQKTRHPFRECWPDQSARN